MSTHVQGVPLQNQVSTRDCQIEGDRYGFGSFAVTLGGGYAAHYYGMKSYPMIATYNPWVKLAVLGGVAAVAFHYTRDYAKRRCIESTTKPNRSR